VIDEHAQAVLSLLNAAVTSPRKVFDGKVPDNTDPRATPYVLVYFDDSDPEFDFRAQAWAFVMTVTCHSVGGNAQATRQVADMVRSALLAVTPTISGRSCHPITRIPGAPTERDESTGMLVMDRIDQYELRSVPG
jgi:hypothetical protein